MYELTIEIIKKYLATLAPDQSAGVVADAYYCPVAKALEHEYGVPFVASEWSYGPRENFSLEKAQTPPDIAELIRAIDRVGTFPRPISRSEVEGVLGL